MDPMACSAYSVLSDEYLYSYLLAVPTYVARTNRFMMVEQHFEEVRVPNVVDGGHDDVRVFHVGGHLVLSTAIHPVVPFYLRRRGRGGVSEVYE